VVGLSVADTYTLYSMAITEDERALLRRDGGLAWRSLRDAGPSNLFAAPGDRTVLEELEREGKIASVREYLDFFPFARVRDGELNIEDDIFMECLINTIKNETISYQIFIKKNSKKQKRRLIERIENLKKNSEPGNDEILALESILNRQIDLELRSEIENLNSFEYLNDEKITPYFVSLAKNNKAAATTDAICDDNGIPFNSSAERNSFVRNFYANLYKIPAGQAENVEGCIEEFLGPDIVNSRLVQDSKISLNQKLDLETDFTIEELDVSAMQGNRSAAGMDGLSNCFIKRYWHYFRKPLLRYLTRCLSISRLTDTFKTAKIKIIPKKGDCTKIGNWRPISLLSCLYKVMSRALNNRLKKVRDVIFSRAQKGFTNERHIQEVLINVIESIAFCKKYNIRPVF
jgi:hypothetical protein